ncbi:MAG: RNA polymerase sigma-70 factor [Prevotella sp.]|nr:RNA polymerase sigma-70 factor [Prevotella sp.]MBQ9224231.1 RNA polymerase sigma-70 factor [Prevotella sp.]
MSDQQLSTWDENVFHQLYNNYYKALVNYAMQMLGTQDSAEDVVQNAFMQLWQQGRQSRGDNHIRAFLYNITRNAAIDRLRHDKIVQDYQESYEINANGEEDSIFTEEVFRQLFEEIDRLPSRQREIFLLLMKGQKNREIAENLNIAEETVKKLRFRGMKTLRQRMNPKVYLMLTMMVM